MTPLPYEPRFPPEERHDLMDRDGNRWSARFDGVYLGLNDSEWRILFTRPGAAAVAHVEPGTSIEHESFLADLLGQAEDPSFEALASGPLYDFVAEVVAGRCPFECGRERSNRYIIRLVGDHGDRKIELAEHVFPTHDDAVAEVIREAISDLEA